MTTNMKTITFLPLTFLLLVSCSSCKPDPEIPETKPQQLNISILLDLSDRIDKNLHPFQEQVDLESIQKIISLFKQQLTEVGVYDAKGKMKIIFYPSPDNDSIISIAKRLSVDFSKADSSSMQGISDKIKMFGAFDTSFMSNVKKLYLSSCQSKAYPGADIFSFFKDEIDDQCIENDPCYRNILVIVTDGYMYWDKDKTNPIGNRYTYITPKSIQLTRFRKMKNWESDFDKYDYGFVNVNKKLPDLEVLVWGIDPTETEDYDIIKKYWEKWFSEMEIKSSKIKIVKTELPIKTNIIENFFQKK